MPRRRPLAAALTLALVAPVSALTASVATAAPAHSASAHSASAHPWSTTTGVAASASTAPGASSLGAKRLPRPTPAKGAGRAHDPHTVLVRFKGTAGSGTRDRAVKRRGASLGRTLPGTSFVTVHTSGAADELASRLATDPSVAEVSLDYVREASATPNDPGYTYGDQDYLKTVRLPGAWDRSKGSLGTVVAVLDSGVNGRHPDLTGRTVAGWNAVSNVGIAAGAASDDYGHGSMVAGIIAAETNNGEGIAGVAWNARVMPVKVLNSRGQGTDSDVIEGINWAVGHGARIINLSLGGSTDNPALHTAIRSAVAKGAVVVVAAGNTGDDAPQYPAAYSEVIAVGATDNTGALTDFSTHGSWVDLAAPGWAITSTGRPDSQGNLYYVGDGTSFSAPIVSGVVALMRAKTPSMTPAQVLARLRATARDAGPRGIDPYYGAGLLDATNALGGGYAADLPLPGAGANEPDDTPTRAVGFETSGTSHGSIGIEGDLDWRRYDFPSRRTVTFTVAPPYYDASVPQNVDPVLAVYDENLRLIAQVDQKAEGQPETVTVRVPGTTYLTVRNANGSRVGDPRYYSVTVEQGAAGVLNPGAAFATSTSYGPLAYGDVTGDGRGDVVAGVATSPATSQLDVMAQASIGGLTAPVHYATSEGSLVRNVATGDVDGDGLRDVVVSTAVGIQVFRQTAGHVLAAPVVVPDTADTTFVAAADLDGDGRADLVSTTATEASTEVSVLHPQPNGSWTRELLDTTDGSVRRGTVVIGDLDGDARPDVAVNQFGSVLVLHQRAGGWEATTHSLPTDTGASGIVIADVNGDGRLDLATAGGGNRPSSRLVVWRQQADGTLPAAPTSTEIPDIPASLAAADLTGDGRTDLVATHSGFATVSVLEQRSDGTLRPASGSFTSYISHYDPTALAVGDVTGDGRVDAVVAPNTGVEVLSNAGGLTPTVAPQFVRSTWPADFGSGLPVTTTPTVTFVRDVVGSTVTASTVRLVNGRTGAAVPATVTYDAARRTATVKPSTPLYDWAPYRLTVSGVKDTTGASMTTAYSSTFRTTDLAPAAVGAFRATGALRAATLTWTAPHANDIDRFIVRMAPSSTPPSSVTAGTSAYSGTATRATVSLAQGTTYSFRIWARDRTGHYSPSSWGRLVGTVESMTSNVTSVRKGYPVTLSGRIVRKDTGKAVAGATMQLYWRRVGSATWTLTAVRTSSSTGTFSYAHKPGASVDYMWVYRGSSALVGSSSALRRVTVR
ncbi:S8 family serine peptidase [Intrasporangium flavum]|uniref:S8 family serine peptidase n=1 Tax=Intrasporangium flavum TaxID=1428657 RepID=UPI00096EA36C|nr:S8 family serine peptidase [Intrasporangium flavum]